MNKRFVKDSIYALGLDKPLFLAQSMLSDNIPMLAYHRILDVPNRDSYPFDLHLVNASIDQFRQQMRLVKKYYTPITYQMLADHLFENEPLPSNPLIVTFDDGFDDFYHNAAPIFDELNIPATIFVATDYIDDENTFWYEYLAVLFYNQKSKVLHLESLHYDVELRDGYEHRFSAYEQFINLIKKLDNEGRLQVMQEVEAKYGDLYYGLDEQTKSLSRVMTWDQLRELSANDIEIQSHTKSHPILTSIGEASLYEELKLSKDKIELELGNKVIAIAYPNGTSHDYSEATIKVARELGYLFGITHIRGGNKLKQLEMFDMKRTWFDNPERINLMPLLVPDRF